MSDSNVPSVPVTSGTSLSTINTQAIQTKKEAVIELYSQIGNLSETSRRLGVDRRTIYTWINNDPEFFDSYTAARWMSAEPLLAEATARATIGQDKPVIYQGEIKDYYKEKSDNLLMFLIKGVRPEYAQEQVHHTGSTGNNNVVIVLQGSDEDRDRLNKVMGIASPSDQGTGAGGGYGTSA